MVDYSERLTWALNNSGATITELAEYLGTSYQAAKKVVDGKSSAFNAANNAKAAQFLKVSGDWLALGVGAKERDAEVIQPAGNYVPDGYVRLQHFSPQPSMGHGNLIDYSPQIIQHIDVLAQWVKQKVGSTNPDRIKILTGSGNSMSPTIQDGDLVFVDIECKSIEAAGIYVLDVAGRFILKKAMIQANGTLIIRSDNTQEFPDEERYDLKRADDSIIVCGKVLAWWTLRKG